MNIADNILSGVKYAAEATEERLHMHALEYTKVPVAENEVDDEEELKPADTNEKDHAAEEQKLDSGEGTEQANETEEAEDLESPSTENEETVKNDAEELSDKEFIEANT